MLYFTVQTSPPRLPWLLALLLALAVVAATPHLVGAAECVKCLETPGATSLGNCLGHGSADTPTAARFHLPTPLSPHPLLSAHVGVWTASSRRSVRTSNAIGPLTCC